MTLSALHPAPASGPTRGGHILDAAQRALVELGSLLRDSGYRFITVTPQTHRRVVARRERALGIRDVFGWSLPFDAALLPARMLEVMERAQILVEKSPGTWQSLVRFSSVDDQLCVHSAYPTVQPDAVFFGPDSYRFLRLLEQVPGPLGRLVDVGCGSGVGGLVAASRASAVVLGDVNPRALRLAEVNAALWNVPHARAVHSDVLASVDGPVDTIICNPPYLVDARKRAYRDGGGTRGMQLGLRVVRESVARLPRGGRVVLYTGVPVVDEKNLFLDALNSEVGAANVRVLAQEMDPDVFGEELDGAAYWDVERIAVMGVVVEKL